MAVAIAILRLSSLGDIVLTSPLVDALRHKYHDARIDFVVKKEYAELAERLPGVSHVISIDTSNGIEGLRKLKHQLRKNEYDIVLDLHNNTRTIYLRSGLAPYVSVIKKRSYKRLLLVRKKIDFLENVPDVIGRYFETAFDLGVPDDGKAPRLVKKLHFASTQDIFRVALCPGSKHWNKQWPTEYWQRLAQELAEVNVMLEFYGSKSEQPIVNEILKAIPSTSQVKDFTGVLPLPKVIDYMARCRIAITNDSGLMHIANAVGIPTISFFGPTVKAFGFAPRAETAQILEVEGLYCRPCTTIGRNDCPEKHFRCMRELTPESVLERFHKVYRDHYLFH